MGAFALYFLQEKTTTTSNVMKIKLCFFTFLCSCWFCCVFVLNWNGIKSAYIELRRRKWCIYGCEYEKLFLRCFAQWTMEIHQRKRKQKKWNKKKHAKIKTREKKCAITYRSFVFCAICFAVIAVPFIENEDTGH